MTTDVKTQTSVLQKNISDYPQYSELELVTKSNTPMLAAIISKRLQ